LQGVKNDQQQASIAGSIAAAHYIRAVAPSYGIPVVLHTDHCAKKLLPWLDGMMDADEAYFKEHGEPLFSSHMIDLSEEAVDWNIETTAKYLKRAAPMKQWLEMVSVIGSVTGNRYSQMGRKSASLAVRKTV
jgi:fructose-bisphosphate aldolase, class II